MKYSVRNSQEQASYQNSLHELVQPSHITGRMKGRWNIVFTYWIHGTISSCTFKGTDLKHIQRNTFKWQLYMSWEQPTDPHFYFSPMLPIALTLAVPSSVVYLLKFDSVNSIYSLQGLIALSALKSYSMVQAPPFDNNLISLLTLLVYQQIHHCQLQMMKQINFFWDSVIKELLWSPKLSAIPRVFVLITDQLNYQHSKTGRTMCWTYSLKHILFIVLYNVSQALLS